MADFLAQVRTQIDNSSIQDLPSVAARVMAQIEAEARQAVSRGQSLAGLSSRVQGVQVAYEQRVQGALNLPVGAAGQMRAEFAQILQTTMAQLRTLNPNVRALDPADVGGMVSQGRRDSRAAARAAAMAQRQAAESQLEATAQRDAREAVQKRAAAERQRLAEIRVLRDETSQEANLIISRKLAERQLNRELNARVQAEIKARAAAGEPGFHGGPFQRVQAYVAQRQGGEPRLPSEFLNFRQFLTARFLTTAGFALSGAALYGSVQAIRELIKNGEQLQRVFNQIEAQFRAVDDSAEFPAFRNSILAISRQTGEAAEDVAFVAFQMKGAFGDTTLAVEQTSAAIRIARVTGLELNEVVDSLTASARSFGVDISQIGDNALGIQERFGVLAKETIKGVADLAPVAQEAGLSMRQTFALLGTAQQASGRSGASISEAFGRILPSLQQNGLAIVNLYRTLPQLASGYDRVATAAGRGQMGVVLDQLIRDWDSLDKVQQNEIITMLGGRREAQALISVLQNSKRYIDEVSGSYQDAGKTQAYFSDLQETVAQRLSRLRAVFQSLGEALFRAGLADAFTDILEVGGGMLSFLSAIIRAFARFNEMTGGTAGRMIFLTGAVLGLSKALRALAEAGVLKGLTNVVSGGIAGRLGIGLAGRAEALAALQAGSGRVGIAAAGARGALFGGPVAARTAGAAGTGALGLIGLTPVTALLALTAGSLITYKSLIDKYHRARDVQLKKFLDDEKYSNDELHRMAEEGESFWTSIHNAVFGSESRRDVARAAQRVRGIKESLPEFQAAADAGVFTKGGATGALRQTDIAARFQKGGVNAAQISDILDIPLEQAANFGDVPDSTAISKDYINKIEDAARNGVDGASKMLEIILALQKSTTRGRALLDKALEGSKTIRTAEAQKLYTTAAEGEQAPIIQDADVLKQAYESGQVTTGRYLSSLGGLIDTLHDIERRGGGTLPTEQRKQLIDLVARQRSVMSDLSKQSYELATNLAQASGTSTPESNISRAVDLLHNSKFTNKADRFKIAQDIVGFSRELLQTRVAAADSAEESLRILQEGVVIPEDARIAIIREQITQLNPAIAAFLETWSDGNKQLLESTTQQLAVAIAGGQTAYEAILAMLHTQRKVIGDRINVLAAFANASGVGGGVGAELNELYADLAAIDDQLANLPSAAEINAGVGTPTKVVGSAQEKKDAVEKARQERIAILRSRAEIAKANAAGDPVRQAQIELDLQNQILAEARKGGKENEINQAILGQIQATEALRQARIEQRRAEAEVAKAEAERDPVKSAKLELDEANKELAEARGPIERAHALANQIRAEHAYQDALRDAFAAQHDLIAAVAEATGDLVAAAQARYATALNNLNTAVAEGTTGPELDRLKAAVVTAQASVRDARLNEAFRQIDVAVQLERITTSQAIAQLEALLTIPGLTKEQTDSILLKIDQMKKGLNRDLQFNLPEDIDLAGLFYQSRRLVQGIEAGQHYQDNRAIAVTNHNYNSTDYEGAINGTLARLSAAPRVGMAPRRY